MISIFTVAMMKGVGVANTVKWFGGACYEGFV